MKPKLKIGQYLWCKTDNWPAVITRVTDIEFTIKCRQKNLNLTKFTYGHVRYPLSAFDKYWRPLKVTEEQFRAIESLVCDSFIGH